MIPPILADCSKPFSECRRHNTPSVAAAVSKEPRHWAYRADFEPLTEHVTGCARPTASITIVVPQHCRLRVRCCRPTTAPRAMLMIVGWSCRGSALRMREDHEGFVVAF